MKNKLTILSEDLWGLKDEHTASKYILQKLQASGFDLSRDIEKQELPNAVIFTQEIE